MHWPVMEEVNDNEKTEMIDKMSIKETRRDLFFIFILLQDRHASRKFVFNE